MSRRPGEFALRQARARSSIDVRTRAEWAYVGIPDLGPIGKRAVLVEWQTFPDQAVDPRFAERLGRMSLRTLGVRGGRRPLLHLPFGKPKPGCGQGDGSSGIPRLSQCCRRLRRTARRREASWLRRGLEGGRSSLVSALEWLQGCSAIGAWAHCLLMRYSLLPSLNLHS